MNGLTDYHIHSKFSPDADNTIDQICRHALHIGFQEIAITEHKEWHPDWVGIFRVEGYFEVLERAKKEYQLSGLTLYSGVEVGNPHDFREQYTDFISKYPFDFVLAALHWLNGESIHSKACFRGRDPNEVYDQYFKEIERMSRSCQFDILVHFDRIFWQGMLLGAAPDLTKLELSIRAALSALVEREQALELNTRFLDHEPNWNTVIQTVFQWFHEEGGRQVVVNSDAHRIDQIGRNFDTAMRILSKTGYEQGIIFPITKDEEQALAM